MATQTPDSWSQWDFPTLKAIRDLFDEAPDAPQLQSAAVLSRLAPDGSDQPQWGRAIDRLARNGYLETAGRMNGLNYPMFILRLTERALRATGEWPAEGHVLEDLAEMLDAEADRIAVAEPEKAGRLRQAAGVVLKAAEEVGVEFGVRLLSRLAGMP